MLNQLSVFWHEWNWLIATGWGVVMVFVLMFFRGVSINKEKEDCYDSTRTSKTD